jgi:acyl carrier protein
MSLGGETNVNHGMKLFWTKSLKVQQDTRMTANGSLGDIKEKVRAFVLEYAAHRGVTSVGDDESILTSNLIDSLGSLRMIDFLETAFPLTIEDTDMLPENFQTLNACESFIKGKLGIPLHESGEAAEKSKIEGTPAPELVNA